MNKINLLPWRQKLLLSQKMSVIRALLGTILIAFLILFAINKILDSRLKSIKQQNESLTSEIKNLNAELQQAKMAAEQQEKLGYLTTIIQKKKQQQREIVQLLAMMPNIMPQGLYLTKINFANQAFILSGKAALHTDITNLMERLAKLPEVETVQLYGLDSNGSQAKETDFQINIALKN